MQRSIDTENKQEDVKYTVKCIIENLDGISSWIKALSTEEMRKKIIDTGEIYAKDFLSSIKML